MDYHTYEGHYEYSEGSPPIHTQSEDGSDDKSEAPSNYNSIVTSGYNYDVSEVLIGLILFISFTSTLFEIFRYIIQSCLKTRQKRSLVIRILTSIDEELNDYCSICLDKYVKDDRLILLSCNHYFHEDCLLPWIDHNNTCPHCRRNIF